MGMRKTFVTLATVLSLVTLCPSGVLAQGRDPASRYVRCMDRAEDNFEDCLDSARRTELLCWSRYGYAKLWCTILYGVEVIVG